MPPSTDPCHLLLPGMDRTARVQLQSPSSPVAIRRDSDVTLRCRADGSGDVTYQWFRNGERLTRAPGRALRNKRLHLGGVQARDNGVYSCRATNAAGSAHSDVTFPLIVPGEYDGRQWCMGKSGTSKYSWL